MTPFDPQAGGGVLGCGGPRASAAVLWGTRLKQEGGQSTDLRISRRNHASTPTRITAGREAVAGREAYTVVTQARRKTFEEPRPDPLSTPTMKPGFRKGE